eukprot:6202513-Pleurochrysis_carterae.AAC.2
MQQQPRGDASTACNLVYSSHYKDAEIERARSVFQWTLRTRATFECKAADCGPKSILDHATTSLKLRCVLRDARSMNEAWILTADSVLLTVHATEPLQCALLPR